MNFQRGKKHEDLELNLVPLIDVLLVIIIFLVVSTTFSRFSELKINLPTAEANSPDKKPNVINVIFGFSVPNLLTKFLSINFPIPKSIIYNLPFLNI